MKAHTEVPVQSPAEVPVKSRATHFIITIAIGLFLLIGLMLLPTQAPLTQAGAVPTPVVVMNPSADSVNVTWFNVDTTTTDERSSGLQLYTYEYCNIQWITDHTAVGAGANTTTLRVDWSMDNTTWANGPNIIAANAADDNAIVQIPNLGRYMAVYADHDTTASGAAITLTVKGLCK